MLKRNETLTNIEPNCNHIEYIRNGDKSSCEYDIKLSFYSEDYLMIFINGDRLPRQDYEILGDRQDCINGNAVIHILNRGNAGDKLKITALSNQQSPAKIN